MENLLITLLATSSVDSLNPIGITQQFILQGMVKKPRHIWYFILTTGVVNMIFGYLVYYGAINGLSHLIRKYSWVVDMAGIVLGAGLLIYSIIDFVRKVIRRKNHTTTATDFDAEEEKVKSRIRSVTPLALIGIGVVSTVSELTSAVPYFAFLAVLVTYELPFWLLTLIFILYNIIYIAPFMLMYVVYIISQKQFDRLYLFFKKHLSRFSEFLLPALLFIIGAAILWNVAVK